MLISARESSRILAAAGLSRQQSRRALLSGLAGEAVRTGGALLYDEQRVQGLSRWPDVVHEHLLDACTGGVLVIRLRVRCLAAGQRPSELGLEHAGEWCRLLEGRRLVTSPGPRWLLLGAQPYLGRAARARQRGETVGAGRSTTWPRDD